MTGAEMEDHSAVWRIAASLPALVIAGMLWICPAMALDATLANPVPADRLSDPAPPSRWASAPHMQVEREFAGPIPDTIIHRWRDPDNGTLCYVYVPIVEQASASPNPRPVVYGAAAIGSISCLPGTTPSQ